MDIDINDTNETLESKVANIAIGMLDKYMENPQLYTAKPQTGEPTFTRKFEGPDEIIDWKKNPIQIHNQIRALGCGRTKINGIDVKILETKPYGTYHTCGGGSTSWYGFAKEIFEQAGLKVNLKPCTTEEFPRPAKRPAYSIMNNEGLLRDWKQALKGYMALRVEV